MHRIINNNIVITTYVPTLSKTHQVKYYVLLYQK